MWILYFLPKKWLSYLAGLMMHVRWPSKTFSQLTIRVFAGMYKINISEAEKTLDQYQSIGDFFVRKLKPGVRPIAFTSLVHPADSVISQMGPLQNGKCVQAKDRLYSVSDLCQNTKWSAEFSKGFFTTYYLCPTDYHRVHSPVKGVITDIMHIPGHLWPVNQWSTSNIENLFAVNERVVLRIETELGPCLLVFVGATNVGKIRLSFDSSILTNTKPWQNEPVLHKTLNPTLSIEKGDELGMFHMGSTVVMIYSSQVTSLFEKSLASGKKSEDLGLGQSVKMGGEFL